MNGNNKVFESRLSVFEGPDREENKLRYESAYGETKGSRIARKKSTRNQRIKSDIAEDVNKE